MSISHQILASRKLKSWHHPDVINFIRTGNPALMNRLPSTDWTGNILDLLPPACEWSDEATNIIRIAVHQGLKGVITRWLRRYGKDPGANWLQFDAAIAILRQQGVTDSWIAGCLGEMTLFDKESLTTTPAGHLLLQLSDADLSSVGMLDRHGYAAAAASDDPDRLTRLVATTRNAIAPHLPWGLIVRIRPQFRDLALQRASPSEIKHEVLPALAKIFPALYRQSAIDQFTASLNDPGNELQQSDDVKGLIDLLGDEATPILLDWMENVHNQEPFDAACEREELLKEFRDLNTDVDLARASEAMSRSSVPLVAAVGVKAVRAYGGDIPANELAGRLRPALESDDEWTVYSALCAACSEDCAFLMKEVFNALKQPSVLTRRAALRLLSYRGFEEIRAGGLKLLASGKAAARLAAVILFQRNGSPEALAALRARLDTEGSEAVRDAILIALDRAGGNVVSAEEQAARMAKTLARARACPVAWLDPAALRLVRTDGTALTSDEVLYLLIRQSRCGEMRADIEARPLLLTLDRKASGASALVMLERFLASPQEAGDRWVVALAALCGDDRLIPPLHKAILTWAENARGKLAEYGAGALALLGSDAALTVLESLTVRFRSKNKNIGQAAGDAFAAAAEARGVTVEELGDLVVPWLGFEPGVRRVLSCGQHSWELWIGPDFKTVYKDLKTGKKVNKLPAAAGPALLDEQKAFAAGLKEAVKAQVLRMETLLVRQFRWPVARWLQLYPVHPLLRPFAEQLIWCHHPEDGGPFTAFRYTGDGSLTTVSAGTFELPASGGISLLHPLSLSEPDKSAWEDHLADYEVMPPFPQLQRPVFRCPEAEASATRLQTVAGTELNAMTFRGRAERLGWVRGSVCDGGTISTYRKVFSGTGVDAFLDLDGMAVGIGVDGSVTLGAAWFVKSGTVKIGSYVYDEPSGEADPRLIPAGSVPPVAWSEVMADLYKISGRESAANEPEA